MVTLRAFTVNVRHSTHRIEQYALLLMQTFRDLINEATIVVVFIIIIIIIKKTDFSCRKH